MKTHGLLLLCGLIFLPVSAVFSQTTTGVPTAKDNTLFESATGHLSGGAEPHLFAGKTNSGLIRRAVINHDLAGVIPPGVTILDVSLTLEMNQTSSGPKQMSLHRITADWGEGASSSGGSGGGGAAAQTNDATWIHTFHNGSLWSAPGGDFNPAPSATITVDQPGSYTWAGAQMVADVQDWVFNPGGNFGWILIGDESANNTAKRFLSRENAGSAPSLYVTYMLPCTAPEVPVIPGGAFCAGEIINFTVSANLNDATEWHLYEDSCGGTAVAVSATGQFTISPATTTSYFVRGEGGCVSPGPCGSFTVTVTSVDTTVSQSGSTLTANANGVNYSWFQCGAIPSPTPLSSSQSYTPTASGQYRVVITDQNGCSNTSACFAVVVNGLNADLAAGVKIYPNPASSYFQIDLPAALIPATLQVQTLTGQTVYSDKYISAGTETISLPNLPTGQYLLKIVAPEQPVVVKKLLIRN